MSKMDDLRRLRESPRRKAAQKRLPVRSKPSAQPNPHADASDATDGSLMTPAMMGRKGGRSRMKALTPEQRSELARLGGLARAKKLKQVSTA